MSHPPLSPKREAEAQQLPQHLRRAADEGLLATARALVATEEHTLFGTTEFAVRDLAHRIGAKAYQAYLAQKNGYRGSSATCQGCGQAAKFQGYRPRTPVSLLGPLPLRRASYCRGRCGHGPAPSDGAAGLTAKRLAPGAERLTALAGLLSDSCEEAAEKVLPELAGLRLSEATAGRTTEAAGARLRRPWAAGRTPGSPRPWDWPKGARGRTCACASIGAIGAAQQAGGGGKAEGRMPYVAMIYNPAPGFPAAAEVRRPPAPVRPPRVAARQQARYLAGLYGLEQR